MECCQTQYARWALETSYARLINDILSKAHSKHLIGDGMHRDAMDSTSESKSQKTRQFIEVITSRILLDPRTYPAFLEILRSSRSFDPIATTIEESVDSLCDCSPFCKKPRKLLCEFNARTGKENLPSTAAENCPLIFKKLETQHQKAREDLKKCIDTVAELKASHEREQELKEKSKKMIAALKDSLHREQTEKEELQMALDEAEDKLSDTLSGLKNSRRKSKASPDKCQRRLSNVDGILSINEKHSTPPPPYSKIL